MNSFCIVMLDKYTLLNPLFGWFHHIEFGLKLSTEIFRTMNNILQVHTLSKNKRSSHKKIRHNKAEMPIDH